jgi:predicted TIM-barrel fold metal-dependent hydrolase
MTVSDPARVKAALDHPVVDADGHIVESIPAVVALMRQLGGSAVADRFTSSSPTYTSRRAPLLERHDTGRPATLRGAIPAWWTLPTDARDRATGFLPALLHERMDELGLDFSILYPSVGLTCMAHPDDEIRTVACRAVNTYLAQVTDGLGDRLTAAAVIPTHTPDEALAELDHAVLELGLKAVLCNNVVPRPLAGAEPGARWLDVLALDSVHDYDPLWARCVELGVAVTVHAPTMGTELRQSSSRYMYNHIGTFAASAEAFAKALVFGGVAQRFDQLTFGFLECGVAWGVQLLADLVGRLEKRGADAIGRLDPSLVDLEVWDELLVRYGGELFSDPAVRRAMAGQSDNPPAELDDFRDAGLDEPGDLAAQFDRFYFGCEADDATVGWAFAAATNPLGAVLHPMLGSDLGHWDVPDLRGILPEAYELVEEGRLDRAAFRAFACDNPIALHATMNPAFFDGTPVEAYARALVGTPAARGSGPLP